MIRFSSSALIGSLAIAGFISLAPAGQAHAQDRVSESVVLTFDETALSDRATARKVLSSLKVQARKACSTETPLTRVSLVDQVCVEDVLDQAITAINDPMLTNIFAQVEETSEAIKVASVD